jgi:hypothetical protein
MLNFGNRYSGATFGHIYHYQDSTIRKILIFSFQQRVAVALARKNPEIIRERDRGFLNFFCACIPINWGVLF